MQTQGSKDFFCLKEPKFKDLKSAPSRDNAAELPKKDDKKDKKKRFQSQRREHTKEWKKQTSATSVNTTNNLKKKRWGMTLLRLRVSTAIKKATLPATTSS